MISGDISEDHALIKVVPEEPGKPVTFEVRYRTVRIWNGWNYYHPSAYVVGLKGSDGEGFSHHYTFEKAVQAVFIRARRYERAYARRRAS